MFHQLTANEGEVMRPPHPMVVRFLHSPKAVLDAGGREAAREAARVFDINKGGLSFPSSLLDFRLLMMGFPVHSADKEGETWPESDDAGRRVGFCSLFSTA